MPNMPLWNQCERVKAKKFIVNVFYRDEKREKAEKNDRKGALEHCL